MVGSGIASSLVHEVGHQASALLDLVESLRPALQGLQQNGGREQIAWGLWERWLSEILADLWSVPGWGLRPHSDSSGWSACRAPLCFASAWMTPTRSLGCASD